MGAKASTANGEQSPRARTFSTSSSSDVVSGGAGFSLLRAIPGIQMANDRQRARSLSSVPDLHASHEAIAIPANSQSYEASAAASPDTDSSSNEDTGPVAVAGTSLALGRVYAAHSLPSHIWSLNAHLRPSGHVANADDIDLIVLEAEPRGWWGLVAVAIVDCRWFRCGVDR
ncbi:jg19088 [Pararge aegeria aegeria]|uniref:Jg19088 protein n=1 Tax=Pararge aegeria aegeria TaxID=348720 RepID=A0A8S4SIK4_9NEOP|nr:jg19088 [Pararge aegeria aegeria]